MTSETRGLRLLGLLTLLAGAGGLALLALYVRPAALLQALSAFDLRLLPLLLLLATADYAVRFLRWRLLVKAATCTSPPLVPDLACFLAANTLLLTPARAGDISRAFYSRALFGTPATSTAPIPVLERLVDVVLMACFASLGPIFFGLSPLYSAGGLVLASAATLLLFTRRCNVMIVSLIHRFVGERRAAQTESVFSSMRSLAAPRPLGVAFGLGAVAWCLECAAFFAVLTGLGLTATASLTGQAAFIYPVANLLASVSLIPGGIGIAEGSIAGLTVQLTAADTATALAAGLIIRAAIVGFGILTGLPGLFYVSNRLTRTQPLTQPTTVLPAST